MTVTKMAFQLQHCNTRHPDNPTTTVWQWNCRGFKLKYGSLAQSIASSTDPPDIVAIQETNTRAHLPGYTTYSTDAGLSLHTLVDKKTYCHTTLSPTSRTDWYSA